ncbi:MULTISPECIES: helix-turn-helix domain-containing protein [unclassified Modestobacter]|uniref:helix-turn-helix domain-containing protein n=1 Tax=unclassified Modestobacter TaxID=2643866 RepID=UPI0022AA7B3C|nr:MULTISPECIES: helix-turn-helix transcriptional regulator [unclassified Modestobacter]MCZ2824304.1 helix-turn-helix transcriptional regulator [Modestobacter sp. VKM Ac-2981]MCZ2854168.1 helix-turn-helix transcriptional regulator [Modestobacter sp. VKM Ac-2982]
MTELGEFLRVRRAALQPADVGLRGYGARRVPGLRREELAMLAGVSATYYARLEQGLSANASEAVLDALARALELDADEQTHLRTLARTPARRRSRSRPDVIRPGMLRLIESMPDTPAVVLGRRSEVLGWNPLGHRLVAGHLPFDSPHRPAERPNMTRLLFLDAHTRELYTRWDDEAQRAVSSLRVLAGRSPDDDELTRLVGELTVQSAEFARLWARHPVANCVSGSKHLRHPEVGELEVAFEVLTPPDDAGHRVLLYTAAAGTPSASALELLRRAHSPTHFAGLRARAGRCGS